MPAKSYFGYNLRKYRELHGISQTQMAQKVGLSQSDISKYEIGFSTPFGVRMCNISNVMGVSVNELMAHPIEWSAQAAPNVEEQNFMAESDNDDEDMER